MGRLKTEKFKLHSQNQKSKIEPKSTWGSNRGGRPWRRKRERILIRDNYTCQNPECGIVGIDMEVDHILNLARGGTDDDSNLQCLCRECHKKKTQIESRIGGGHA